MDIDEVKKQRTVLQDQIRSMLTTFEVETGAIISGIHFDRVDLYGADPTPKTQALRFTIYLSIP